VEPGPSFRRAEAWAVGCCAVWGSRRSPSGVALARGARAVVARSAIGAKRRPLRRVLSSRDGEWRGPRGDRGRSALLIGRGSASGYILRIRFGSWQIFECLCSCVSLLINTLPPVTGALFIRKAPWLQGFRARPVGENTFLGGRKHVRAVGETTFFGGRFHARGGRKHVESPFFSPPKDLGKRPLTDNSVALYWWVKTRFPSLLALLRWNARTP